MKASLFLLIALSGCVPVIEDVVAPMAEAEVEKCMSHDKSDCVVNEIEQYEKSKP